MEEFKNPNGTYNGVKMLAQLSGLSEDEITWTWNRAKELKQSGMPIDQVKATLKEEGKDKPWLNK